MEAEQALKDGESKEETTEEKEEATTERKKKNGLKILDATAAPGNKTTMAAALAGEFGRVAAVERDQGRFKVLKEMCLKAGCKSKSELLSVTPALVSTKYFGLPYACC